MRGERRIGSCFTAADVCLSSFLMKHSSVIYADGRYEIDGVVNEKGRKGRRLRDGCSRS
jgi:hypothetical protein